eukprot:scaffold199_cov138-Isochrysis_galbana.AAC.4
MDETWKNWSSFTLSRSRSRACGAMSRRMAANRAAVGVAETRQCMERRNAAAGAGSSASRSGANRPRAPSYRSAEPRPVPGLQFKTRFNDAEAPAMADSDGPAGGPTRMDMWRGLLFAAALDVGATSGRVQRTIYSVPCAPQAWQEDSLKNRQVHVRVVEGDFRRHGQLRSIRGVQMHSQPQGLCAQRRMCTGSGRWTTTPLTQSKRRAVRMPTDAVVGHHPSSLARRECVPSEPKIEVPGPKVRGGSLLYSAEVKTEPLNNPTGH